MLHGNSESWMFYYFLTMTLFFLPSHTAAAATHEAIYTNAWEKRKVKDFLVIRLLRRRNRYNFSFEKCLALSFWCSSLVGNKSMSIGVEVFRIETESNFKLWKKHEKFLDRIEVDSLPQPKKRGKTFARFKRNFLRPPPLPLPSFVSEIFHQYLLLYPK